VLNGQIPQAAIRAAGTPEVLFQLKLLDTSSTTNPVILIKKQGSVTLNGDKYDVAVTFTNVPVLPCVASMSISGGYITDATDSQNYSTWFAAKDLVSGDNSITLYGQGSKTAADVAVNLLERLIADTSNVANLATPVVAKVDQVVAGLNLTSTTVYDDAYSAYQQLYGTTQPPADAEFALPTGYSSLAYPKKDATTNLSITNFASDSEVYLTLMNRSTGSLAPSWSVSRTSSNIRAESAKVRLNINGEPITEEQRLHLMLRKARRQLPTPNDMAPLVRPSLRAVSVNDQLNFQAYTTGTVLSTITATCKRVVSISGTTKNVYFFLDNNDLSQAGLETVLDGIANSWASIYSTNRTVFGAEPEGTFNGLDVNDFYILLSSSLYTAGYFYSGDLYPSGTGGLLYTNEKKMFYLQFPAGSSDLNKDINDLSATMAHEFQHMIHFYQKRALNDPSYWLDEAMSGYAEYANGYRIENGINQSKALQSQKYFSYVNSISVNQWHSDSDTSDIVNAHYGKAYLFGTWLAMNFGSSGSVQNLLSVQLTEEAAVEAFTGESFDLSFAKFMMALQVNDYSGWSYGFQGLDLTATYSFGSGWADVTLTGPAMTTVDFSAATSGSPTVYPYAAAYIKVINGTGTTLNVSATLPTGVSLFQLKKN
jgi:hypothetical protein